MQETFFTTTTSLIALTSGYGTIRTLQFAPSSQTKFLVLAQCAAGLTYNNITDACQSVLGAAVLLVNGTTVALTDIGNLQTYYCLDASVGTTYTLTLKAKRLHSDGTDKAYCARIAAVGIDDWYRIEQGIEATLSGTTTSTETVLMQDIIEPMFGRSLVFTYSEVNADAAANIRGAYAVEFDSSRIKNQKLLDSIVQQKSGFQEDFTDISYSGSNRWACLSSTNVIDFEGSRSTIQFKTTKLDTSGTAIQFRRLRTVIVPLAENSFGPLHYIYSKGGAEFTDTQTEFVQMSPSPRTVSAYNYLILGSAKTHVGQSSSPVQASFRYHGLGMAGSTNNLVAISGVYAVAATTAMYAAGITFGIRNDDILPIKTYNINSSSAVYPGYNGEQFFGFNVVAATQTVKDSYYLFTGVQYEQNSGAVYRTGDRFMAVLLLPT
jgi:hypothetical protein